MHYFQFLENIANLELRMPVQAGTRMWRRRRSVDRVPQGQPLADPPKEDPDEVRIKLSGLA
jgi:hypothetical protein